MNSTLLERTLCAMGGCDAALLVRAIERGEINPQVSIKETPALLAKTIDAWMRPVPRAADKEQSEIALIALLEKHGAELWAGWGDRNPFFAIHQTRSAPLLVWAARHPKAPRAALTSFLSGEPYSPWFDASAEMVRALSDLGAHANPVDHLGNTPLHLARTSDKVAALVDAGMNGHALNHAGESAWDHWDQAKISSGERKAMEAAIGTRFPFPPEKILREFGRQLLGNGLERTRKRLREAGIEPKDAQWMGLDLIELIAVEIMSRTLDRDGRVIGNPRTEKQHRALLQSTIDMVQPWQLDRQRQARVASVLRLLKADTSAHMEKLIQTPLHEQIMDCARLLERGVQAGLLHNAAYMAASLTAHYFEKIEPADWMRTDADGRTILLHLLSLGTRSWDAAWGMRCGKPEMFSPLSRLPISPSAVHTLLQQPGGLGVMLLLQTKTRTDRLDSIGKAILDYLTPGAIECMDLAAQEPCLPAGIDAIKESQVKEMRALGKTLLRERERQMIAAATPIATVKTVPARL